MKEEIQRQIDFLEREQQRAKEMYNASGFDVTSSVAVLCRQYRDAIKKQIIALRCNIE